MGIEIKKLKIGKKTFDVHRYKIEGFFLGVKRAHHLYFLSNKPGVLVKEELYNRKTGEMDLKFLLDSIDSIKD